METLIITTSTLTNEATLSSDPTLSSNIDTDPYAEYKMAFIAHLLTYKVVWFYLILFVNLHGLLVVSSRDIWAAFSSYIPL